MTIEDFTQKADGIINDFIGGITDEKEFRDDILDLLIEVAKKAVPIEPPVKPATVDNEWAISGGGNNKKRNKDGRII